MKITKSYLKQIIKEELNHIREAEEEPTFADPVKRRQEEEKQRLINFVKDVKIFERMVPQMLTGKFSWRSVSNSIRPYHTFQMFAQDETGALSQIIRGLVDATPEKISGEVKPAVEKIIKNLQAQGKGIETRLLKSGIKPQQLNPTEADFARNGIRAGPQ